MNMLFKICLKSPEKNTEQKQYSLAFQAVCNKEQNNGLMVCVFVKIVYVEGWYCWVLRSVNLGC